MRKILLIPICLILLVGIAFAWVSPIMMGGGSATPNGAIGHPYYSGAWMNTYTSVIYYDTFTTATAGAVNYVHGYIANHNGDTVCFSIFDNANNELASCSFDPGTDAAGWRTCELDVEVILVGGNTYKLGYSTNTTGGDLFEGDSGDSWDYDLISYSCGQNIGADDGDIMTKSMSIYFDNDISCAACE